MKKLLLVIGVKELNNKIISKIKDTDGLILSDRQFYEQKSINIKLCEDILEKQELEAIDEKSLIILKDISEIFLNAACSTNDELTSQKSAVLYAGLQDTPLYFSQSLKYIEAIKKFNPKEVEIIHGVDSKIEISEIIIRYFSNLKIKKTNFSENKLSVFISNLILLCRTNIFLCALASIILEISPFKKNINKLKPASNKKNVLFECSGRLIPFIDAALKLSNVNSVFFLRRHMNIHLSEVRKNNRSLKIHFIHHYGFSIGILLKYIETKINLRKENDISGKLNLKDNNWHNIISSLILKNSAGLIWEYHTSKKFYEKYCPITTILQADNSSIERFLTVFSRKSGVPVIAFQHGAFTEPLNLDGFGADLYVVWGKASVDFLRKNGRSKIGIKCSPTLRRLESVQSIQNITKNEFTYLYATRANSTETASFYNDRENDFWEFILNNFQNETDAKLIIKPHPKANSFNWYKEKSKTVISDNLQLCVTNSSLSKLIETTDFVISTGGTTVLDAVLQKKTCIYIIPPFRQDKAGWSNFSCLHTVDFGDHKKLKFILNNPQQMIINFDKKEFLDERIKFINYYLGNYKKNNFETFMKHILVEANK